MSKRQNRNAWRRTARWLAAVACFFHLQQAWAQSVVLQLRNGDRLSGTILSEDAGQLTLKTSWLNVVVIPVAEIKSRENLPAPAPAPTVLATNPPVAPLALAPPLKHPTPKSWAGEAQAGTDLAFNQRSRQLYTGRFKATYVHDHFRNIFDYLFSYGHIQGVLSDNRMYGSSKTDVDLEHRLYVYNLVGAGYDEIRKINLRYEAGPGVGYHLLKATNFVLNTEFGGNYQAQYNSDNTRAESFYFRFAEDSAWKVNSRFSWDEKYEFFPPVENWGNYRFRFETNLRYALLNNLSLVFTLLEQYDTQPAAGVGQNDLQIRSSLGLKF